MIFPVPISGRRVLPAPLLLLLVPACLPATAKLTTTAPPEPAVATEPGRGLRRPAATPCSSVPSSPCLLLVLPVALLLRRSEAPLLRGAWPLPPLKRPALPVPPLLLLVVVAAGCPCGLVRAGEARPELGSERAVVRLEGRPDVVRAGGLLLLLLMVVVVMVVVGGLREPAISVFRPAGRSGQTK